MKKNKKLTIGIFTDTYIPQFNGVVTSIELFRKELERLGHKVFIFAPSPAQKSDSKRIIRFPSVKFVFYPGIRFAMPYSQKAYDVVKKTKFDIIHAQDPFNIGLFGLWLARKFKIPYISTYHTLYPEYVHYIWKTKITEEIAKKLSKDYCNRNDSIIAPSTKIKSCLTNWGVKKHIDILATGINPKELIVKDRKAAENFRKKQGIKNGEKILLFVGRVAKEKNIDLLFGIMKRFKNEAITLLIVGDGPYRKELEKKVEKSKMRNIIFTGYVDRKHIAMAYAVANLFVFPSTSETQGLVIAEAMISGLPVVAVKDKATQDIIKNNLNGILTEKKSKAFGDAVLKILSDKKLYKKMSDNSKMVAKEFTIEKKTKELIDIYTKLMNKK